VTLKDTHAAKLQERREFEESGLEVVKHAVIKEGFGFTTRLSLKK